jgi:hypothetical protein
MPLSKEELRARRLAALGTSTSPQTNIASVHPAPVASASDEKNSTTAAASPPIAAPLEKRFKQDETLAEYSDTPPLQDVAPMESVDDEDEELRRAIELSKQASQGHSDGGFGDGGHSDPFGDDGGGKLPPESSVRFDESNLSQANDQFDDDIAKAIAMSMSDGGGGSSMAVDSASAAAGAVEDNAVRHADFETQAQFETVRTTPEERKAQIMAPYTPSGEKGTRGEVVHYLKAQHL